ncbi:hypothetical protein ACWD3J_30460 [Streptomyces sp. NPDC002755]|uniref:hypothetical protein n=1 Tax=Streptomyces sp. NPDC002884 TaxID=3154544 RepID=UPI00331B2582
MPRDYDALLEVLDFTKAAGGVPRWRWRLTPSRGQQVPVVADVDLTRGEGGATAPDNYRFLTDPYDFMQNLALHGAAETVTLSRLGEWLCTSVLTPAIWRQLPTGRPSTVLVKLNGDGLEREIVRYPLALAADEKGSLADRKLTFVYDVAAEDSPARVDLNYRAEDNTPLHLVGVFNRTEAGEPVDLHAEQTRVFRTVRRFAAQGGGRDITLNALAYHVTHGRLKDRLESANRSSRHQDSRPWQMILHLADRGAPGSWSAIDGSRQRTSLSADQLIQMLQPGGNDLRLRLAVITTRPAGSPSLADQLEKFGIHPHRPASGDPHVQAPEPDGQLPYKLARGLQCAVLAFRHRIADRSAIDIVETVYEKLLRQHLPLPQALSEALATHRESLEPLDVAAPILYGADACGLKVKPPPHRTGGYNGGPPRQRAAPRLVGHHDTMWTASEIFSGPTEGDVNGAVLYGMHGVGKTTCATELISHYADDYRTVVQYPPDGETMNPDAAEALKGFVAVLLADGAIRQAFETRGEAVPGPAELESFLENETAFERLCGDVAGWLTRSDDSCALVFLSDIESLLAPGDTSSRASWLHPYWERLIVAMTDPKALGFRLLITSAFPLKLGPRMPDVLVPLLAPAEAFLYALSLPHLGKVIGAAPRAVPGPEKRKLVHDVLSLADGHPGLLQYADEAAEQGEAYLRSLADTGIERLAEDEPGRRPDAWRAIGDWTLDALLRLPGDDPRYLLMLVLCRLRPVDRILRRREGDHSVPCLLSQIWAALYNSQDGRLSAAEELEVLLDELRGESLVDLVRLPDRGNAHALIKVRIHPAIADAAGHSDVKTGDGASLRAEVDRIAIEHTAERAKEALRHRLYGGSAEVQRLIRRALPYLERCGDWDTLLVLMAVLMARSRQDYGLDDMMNRLRRVRERISNTGSAQATMATRLLQVLEALYDGGDPGLSALLGEGPGDRVVDSSPVATAMGAGILRGLRETGRLARARHVGDDYLQHVGRGDPVSLIASAVDTELLRVKVDQGELHEALEGTATVLESLVDVRFRDIAHEDWADGEILRRRLFTIRRDCHVLLAETHGPTPEEHEAGAEDRAAHRERARTAHLRLGQYLELANPPETDRYLHTVEGCLTGLDDRLTGDREQLRLLDAELTASLAKVERSGDIALRAMVDVARARIHRTRAGLAVGGGLEQEAHAAMKIARDYERQALRQLYRAGTPMDVGACHRRIADDQLRCQSDQLTASTPVHQMYATLVGDLTGAYLLRRRKKDDALWRGTRTGRGVPATYRELCVRVRDDLDAVDGDHLSGTPDPERLLLKLVDDEAELTEAFRRIFTG